MIKRKLLYMMSSVVILATAMTACGSDDEERVTNETPADEVSMDDVSINEASTNPNERIVGLWVLVKVNEDDVSSQNKVYTFMADGTWTVSPPLPVGESNPDHQVVTFEDGWVYDADKDIITGYLDLQSPSTEQFPYRFELKRRELVLSYEPRDVFYIIPPTPIVHYYIRK